MVIFSNISFNMIDTLIAASIFLYFSSSLKSRHFPPPNYLSFKTYHANKLKQKLLEFNNELNEESLVGFTCFFICFSLLVKYDFTVLLSVVEIE